MAEIKKPKSLRIEMTDGLLIPDRGEKGLFTAWRISFYGAIAAIIFLVVFSKDPYLKIIKFLPDGILSTFTVTFLSIILAIFIGFFAGLGRISRVPLINGLTNIYVEIIRGIPLLVQLFYIYYALGKFFRVPRLAAAVIAMGICYGAYIGEIFRAGIASISKGQMEAALALGLSRGQAIRKIIIPQTIKVILPPLGNEFIALLKDSSLVSILAVADLFRRGKEYASTSFEYFETYTIVALIYLILTLFLSRLVGVMEARLNNERK